MRKIKIAAQVSLVFIFLVIIAGSVVRMTGSGMGCPDWPKCFGHYIPPTAEDQVLWHPQQSFHKGQMIVHNEALWRANQDFISGETYNPGHWTEYTEHDYAIFNPTHTWIEYINRLFGAASGVPVLALFFLSLYKIRSSPLIFVLSLGVLLGLGYEAWLGKLVVDGNLVPNAITKHMFGSMAIVALLLVIVSRTTDRGKLLVGKNFMLVSVVTFALLIVQILLGTQVREQIDAIGKAHENRDLWIGLLDNKVLIHRSASLLFVFAVVWMYWRNWKFDYSMSTVKWLGWLVAAEVVFGIVLYYFSIPKFAQPLHLLIGIILFSVLWWQLLRIKIHG